MEARQPSHMHRGQGSSDAYQDKYRRYPTPTGWVTMLGEELLLPDPEPLDPGLPEPDIIEGLSLRMTQAMNHYQYEEHHCFVCVAIDHFAQDCLHREAFCIWHKKHLTPKWRVFSPRSLPQKASCRSKQACCYN